MADDRRRSPLAHRTPIDAPDGAASLAEQAHQVKLILRGDVGEIGERVANVIGTPLPEPLNSSQTTNFRALWLGPDEWLLISGAETAVDLLSRLTDALAGTHHQLVEVTDQLTTISLSGGKAREMLMKLTTLDMHPSRFRLGEVAGSNFGGATATLHMTADNPPGFDLFVRRSFADYLWCALAEAGREFGLPEQVPKGGERMRG